MDKKIKVVRCPSCGRQKVRLLWIGGVGLYRGFCKCASLLQCGVTGHVRCQFPLSNLFGRVGK